MKKKQLGCLMVLLTLVGLTVYAQGYTGPRLDTITVAEVKNLRDDSPVILRGKIEKSLGDEKYLFTDSTGTITVEIDNRLWNGISVNQNDTVEIRGEVDKDLKGVEIEAKSIKKI
jgi:uncharacterized protein (TIGR00156 family)